jgi:hypothetical protein
VLITVVQYKNFTAWNRRCLPRFLATVKSEFDDALRFLLIDDFFISLALRWIETKKNSPPFLRVSQVFAAKPLTRIYI